MDNRNILLSALSVGVGVGVGIGLSSGQGLSKWGVNGNSSSDGVTPENLEQEMLRMVVDGRETNVTFDQFPFYLRYSFSLQTFVLNLFMYFCILIYIPILYVMTGSRQG